MSDKLQILQTAMSGLCGLWVLGKMFRSNVLIVAVKNYVDFILLE